MLGHWRSGTTLLHELLILDPTAHLPEHLRMLRAASLSCGPSGSCRRCSRWLLPSKRPMDDMQAGWDRPQEDEFALVNMGVPSPYLAWAFPKHGPVCRRVSRPADALGGASAKRGSAAWKQFVQKRRAAEQRRIVLKSPTHTARVKTLLEVFPDARFVHIVRDPLALFPSTVRLWRTLSQVQGLQTLGDDATGSRGTCSTRSCGCTNGSSRTAT